MKTIKQLRSDLAAWGRLVAESEMGDGFARKNALVRMEEIGKLGADIQSDAHLFSHTSAAVYFPKWFKLIDNEIQHLPPQEKVALRYHYVLGVERRHFQGNNKQVLCNAERRLLVC